MFVLFFSRSEITFFVVRESNGQKQQTASFWLVLVHFRVFYCANFQNIGQQNGVIWDVFDMSNFRLWDTVTGACLNLRSLNKREWQLLSQYFYKCQSHLRSWFQTFFGICDFNWQIKMCCEVTLRLFHFCVLEYWRTQKFPESVKEEWNLHCDPTKKKKMK